MYLDIKNSPLHTILNPKSIVFFGASNKFSAMGTTQLLSILSLGFKGNIYPVHPVEEYVQNLKAYKSVAQLPETPELAVIVLPTQIVPQILKECGEKGIKRVIIVSGGFKEVGKEGIDLEKKLLEISSQYDIRFIGPNCIGVVNPYHKLNTTFFRYQNPSGFIGMISQSGSFVTQMFNYLNKFGLGFSAGISVGNEANLDIVDCMEYFALCPNTKVIALYIETIRRGRAFIDAARAIVPNKPIVALYVGGTETGRKAGFSHTGALAGPDKLYDGVFKQSGVIRANTIEELFDFAWALGACPKISGNKITIQTHSGGPGAIAADACERSGLDLSNFSQTTIEKLMPFIPHTGSINNPVDLTFTKNPVDYFTNIPNILLQGKDADGLLVYFLVPNQTVARSMEYLGVPHDQILSQTSTFIKSQCQYISNLVKKYQKPLIGYSFRTRDDLFIQELQDMGIPVLPSPERAANAMSSLIKYDNFKKKLTFLKEAK